MQQPADSSQQSAAATEYKAAAVRLQKRDIGTDAPRFLRAGGGGGGQGGGSGGIGPMKEIMAGFFFNFVSGSSIRHT